MKQNAEASSQICKRDKVRLSKQRVYAMHIAVAKLWLLRCAAVARGVYVYTYIAQAAARLHAAVSSVN